MIHFIKKFSAVLAAAITVTAPMNFCTLPVQTDICAFAASEQEAVTLCGGWFESAYAEWDTNIIGGNVTVSYAESGSSDFTAVDSELVRNGRVDIPGLKGDTSYTLSIKGDKGTAGCTVRTLTYDRTGYAHYNYSGIGAYNDDGTLKPDVTVIYVTNENKDTITYNGKVGLYNIFFSAKPKNVCFRFVGKLDVPAGVVPNDGSHNDGSNMLYLQNSSNVTIEGIGDDTDLIDWGIEMKRCTSCEVRNLWLGHYPDDGISMTGNAQILSEHIWVHNKTIEKGFNAYAGGGHVDADKAEGDGSVDMKWSEYVTVSYNEFIDCHKTSLVGGKADQHQDFITYHHNWFNNTQSRNPRARNAHIHSFNNYFSTNGEYGICASYNSKVFSENNYFEKTNSPLYAINMGKDQYSGTIKSFGDLFDGCTPDEGLAYKIVQSRNESVTIPNLIDGGEGYDNFDLELYSYTPQSPEEAKAEVMKSAGIMKSQDNGSSGTDIPEPADIVKGDVNGDGECNISDAVLLQKWITSVPGTVITDWKNADICEDGVIDVFDLIMLKTSVLSSK